MSITLKSNDGQSFKVSDQACSLSRYLQNQIQNGKSEIDVEEIHELFYDAKSSAKLLHEQAAKYIS